MGNHFYYYVVESARLGGQLWIVHQAYVGMADKVAALVKDCASPPLSAAPRDFRCPTLYGSERSKPACLARIGGALSQPPIWPSRTARSQYQTAYREARPAVFRAIDLPMAADVGCGSAIGKVMVDPNSPASSGRGHSYLRAEGHRARWHRSASRRVAARRGKSALEVVGPGKGGRLS